MLSVCSLLTVSPSLHRIQTPRGESWEESLQINLIGSCCFSLSNWNGLLPIVKLYLSAHQIFTFHLVRSHSNQLENKEWENEKSPVSCFHSVVHTQLDTFSTLAASPPQSGCWGAVRCFLFSLIPNTRFYWSTRLVLWPLNYWTWWAGGKNLK